VRERERERKKERGVGEREIAREQLVTREPTRARARQK